MGLGSGRSYPGVLSKKNSSTEHIFRKRVKEKHVFLFRVGSQLASALR
jgi:hypothetical protein